MSFYRMYLGASVCDLRDIRVEVDFYLGSSSEEERLYDFVYLFIQPMQKWTIEYYAYSVSIFECRIMIRG